MAHQYHPARVSKRSPFLLLFLVFLIMALAVGRRIFGCGFEILFGVQKEARRVRI
jgi:hypothetical protein